MKFQFKKKFLCLILSLILLSSSTGVYARNSARYSEIIGPGLTREEYNVNYNNKNTVIDVLVCDLSNPNLKISVVAGKGKYNQRATVTQMAKRLDSTAMVNGDFFNMLLQGTPEGPSIVDGKLQSSPCVMTGVYSLGIDSDNTAHIEPIQFSGSVTAPNGNSYPVDGLNKSYYWYEPNGEYSHQNKIQLYNDFWAATTRGDKKNTEILINKDGIIEAISQNKSLPYKVPDGKIIMQTDGTATDFILNNAKIGDKLNINYDISPNRNWKFLIGGHALLVSNGQTVPYTKDINVLGGVRARTCAGISADGKTLFIASAEARTKRSAGMKLSDLSDFMKSLGCSTAVNLDGGGSTAMVLKNLGEFSHTRVINPERNAGERPVVSGIGFFNTVAETGPAVGIKVNGPDEMILGQTAEFSIKGAWDENYKPVDPNTMTYDLYDSYNDKEAWNITKFTARNAGPVDITLVTNTGVMGTKTVKVYDFSYIDKLTVTPDRKIVSENDTVTFKVSAKLKNGKTADLDPSTLNFSIDNFDGEFNKGILTVKSLNNHSSAKITASAGDKSVTFPIFDLNAKIIKMTINNQNYSINQEARKMDSKPFIQNSRTMVPVRFIVEALGGNISWNDETKTARIEYNGNIIEIPVGSRNVTVNGEMKQVDSPAVIKDSRTFVPIRFISENLNMTVDYDNAKREVTIIENTDKSVSVSSDAEQDKNINSPSENSEGGIN